jgi:hypothetical protein
MEEVDWWIFCVGKSWKKRTRGSSAKRSHGRRGLVDLLCRKVLEEEVWWIFCARKSWKNRSGGSSV